MLFGGVRKALRNRFSRVFRARSPAEARSRGADLFGVLDLRLRPRSRRTRTAGVVLGVAFESLDGDVVTTVRGAGEAPTPGAAIRMALADFRSALSRSTRLSQTLERLEKTRARSSPPPGAVTHREQATGPMDEKAPRGTHGKAKSARISRAPAGPGRPPRPSGPHRWKSAGSGFLLRGTSHILTSYHVVQGAAHIRISFPSGATYPGAVTAKDANNDLALVLVQGMRPKREGFVPDFAAPVRPGEPVHALGYPLGSRLSRNPSIVSGQVSATTGLEDNIAQFRMTAPINEGNSGGPVINAHGTLIGIAAAGLVQQGVEAVRFATKISAAGVLLGQAQLARKFSISVQPKQEGPLPPHEIFRRYSPHVVLIERK